MAAMKQISRQELQARANLHLNKAVDALDKEGLLVVCLVAPKLDPADGKAVLCTNVDARELPPVLLQAAKQIMEKKAWKGVFD